MENQSNFRKISAVAKRVVAVMTFNGRTNTQAGGFEKKTTRDTEARLIDVRQGYTK